MSNDTLSISQRPTTSTPRRRLEVALPEPGISLEQDAEWCVVREGDHWRRVRFHDYKTLFSIPGLYEKVIYHILQCDSPRVITDRLLQTMNKEGADPRELRVLDLGAGNGIVGELLAKQGADRVVGIDIIDEAARAAERDRPGVYHEYHILDLARLTSEEACALKAQRFNCLTCVAALGFGDIPIEAFSTAFNLIQRDGWIAFNVKEEFLAREDDTGFAGLVRSMTKRGALELQCQHRYQHRLATDREPIHYIALIGRKRADIS